jgi:transketolase
MEKQKSKDLKEIAHRVRENILRISARGGAFTGASLSCADLVVYLYNEFLNIRQETLDSPERDYFFLSKGHAVPVIYSTFVELGWMDQARLENHSKTIDDIYLHPNRKIPGVEFHAGSLGHILSVATGVAIDCKARKSGNKIVCLLGDGELNEGSNWEAALTAAAYNLDNLTVIIDRNRFQANITTEDLIPLEPIDDKFRSFGWAAARINGHDFEIIDEAAQSLPLERKKPTVIIADTVRGKGVPSIENRWDKWMCNFSEEELDQVVGELRSAKAI